MAAATSSKDNEEALEQVNAHKNTRVRTASDQVGAHVDNDVIAPSNQVGDDDGTVVITTSTQVSVGADTDANATSGGVTDQHDKADDTGNVVSAVYLIHI